MTPQTEVWSMICQDQTYEIYVTWKKMKTVRLRVVPGGQIRLSAPRGTSKAWLHRFLQEREAWIRTNVEKMRSMRQIQTDGSNGDKVGKSVTSEKTMTAAQRKQALEYLIPMVEKWYPVVASYGIPMPYVTVRRMSSRYGSCSVGRGRITLAALLLEVPKECAEYVVLHEMTHFLHPDHGKEFYGFIEKYMPDYKQRDRLLKESQRNLQNVSSHL